VAMNGSPGIRKTALPFSAASRMILPFSSSSSRLEIMCTCLPHRLWKRSSEKLGNKLVYNSMNTASADLVSSKPFKLMPFSSFNPKPTKTSSFNTEPL
jgi:hypothetical protein